MSEVVHRAFALAPSGPSFDGLTSRLLALRAEIEAILIDITGQATGLPHDAAVMGAEVAAAVEHGTPPALSVPPVLGEAKAEGCAVVEGTQASLEPGIDDIDAGELLETAAMCCAAAPDQDAADRAEPTIEHPTAIATVAAEPSQGADLHADADMAPAAVASSEICATEVVSAEPGPAGVAASPQPVAPESSAREEHPQGPAAPVDLARRTADGPLAAGSPVPRVGEATVISLSARQRKHKGGAEPSGVATPIRASRHLAAKIAASILVLLTATVALVVADRTAFGSVQSLPWMTPAPSEPTGMDWLLRRLGIGAEQPELADVPLDDGPLASRPAMWGI